MSQQQQPEWAGISELQLYLFNEGTNFESYQMLGAHKTEYGWRFSVWAPHAAGVFLCGDFNSWNTESHPLERIGSTGVWYGVFPELCEGAFYKYAIKASDGQVTLKSDPFAFYSELRPGTASVVYEHSDKIWSDKKWLRTREKTPPYQKPVLIYEMHVGSWRQHEDGSFYSYRELADELIPYLTEMHYTHVEFMPLMEYPFDGSWGYQVTGYFAATSRYGTPDDLKYLINACHKAGIGVIMDWVPAHFPRDLHGLYHFDGTPTYEYADTRLGEHKDWGTMVFDYSKHEVISFLLSSAFFWVKEYHIDGLRVDAVSSMLYRDYSRHSGEWVPNIYGGNHNLEAIRLLQNLNKIMFEHFPNILMIAEESTAWNQVTGDIRNGGLGFNYKWNMGWMNDTLRYMSMDPLFRKDNHNLITFIMFYAFSENFILPLSHDEVVHGKHSLLDKMFGTYEEKFDAYRTLMAYYMTLPGKKLFFMGGEFAQFIEWKFDAPLDWMLLGYEKHQKFHQYMKDLNAFYTSHAALWEDDQSWDGFSWLSHSDYENSVIAYLRRAKDGCVATVLNFTPVRREKYRIGVPEAGTYEVMINSAWKQYGGVLPKRKKQCKAKKRPWGEMPYSIELTLEGNSAIFLIPAEVEEKSTPTAKAKGKTSAQN